MLKVVACQQQNPASFREKHKAQVKQFFTRIQKRTSDHVQQIQTSKDKLRKDIEQLRLDTLVLINSELSNYITQQINDKEQDDQYGI